MIVMVGDKHINFFAQSRRILAIGNSNKSKKENLKILYRKRIRI